MLRSIVCIFVALWYFPGWMLHVYLGLFSPETYRNFGETALIPAYTSLWRDFIMPNILLFALLLAAFEIVVGCLLVGKGQWVKIGLMFSLFFIALQIPLLWGWDERTIPDSIGPAWRAVDAGSIFRRSS